MKLASVVVTRVSSLGNASSNRRAPVWAQTLGAASVNRAMAAREAGIQRMGIGNFIEANHRQDRSGKSNRCTARGAKSEARLSAAAEMTGTAKVIGHNFFRTRTSSENARPPHVARGRSRDPERTVNFSV